MFNVLSLAVCLTNISSAIAASFDLTDMMPARPGLSVETSGKVIAEENVVVAVNEKDGLAVAHQQLIESNADGVRFILVGSGEAILAIGSDNYSVYNNINATMLSKRASYNRAYMKAKAELKKDMNGLQNSCESAADIALEVIDTGNESLANAGVSQTESCKEIIQGSLAGWATYDVYDNPENKSVRVTIISSPKSRKAINRSVGATYSTTDPDEVFKLAIEDIAGGLLPPIGAKVITHANTGEVIVVGYGSSIIRASNNSSLSNKLRQVAERQSQTLSRNALVATMQGESVYWEGSFDTGMFETTEQFQTDPELEDPSNAKALDEDKSLFLSRLRSTDEYETFAAGKVPPGVKSKTFNSEDGFWAYTVTVYAPSLEANSLQAKRDMESGVKAGRAVDNISGRDLNSYRGDNPGGQNPRGPSARVGSDADF